MGNVFTAGDEFQVYRYVQYNNHHFLKTSYMACEIAEWVICHPTNIADIDGPSGENLLEQYSSMPLESEESESESDNGQSPTETETPYSSMDSTHSSQSSYEDLMATQDNRPDRVRFNVCECQHLVQKNPRVKKLLQCGHKFKAAKEFYRWDKRARHECQKCHNVLSGE